MAKKAKKVLTPDEQNQVEILKGLLKGEFSRFDELHNDIQRRLCALGSDVYPEKDDNEDPSFFTQRDRFIAIVDMIDVRAAATTPPYSKSIKRVREAIHKEIVRIEG